MSKAHKKTKYKFVWLTVTLVLIFAYGFAFWYVKTKIEDSTYALSSAQIAYEQKDKIQAALNSMEELQPEIEKIDSYFVGADNVVDFINLLEQKAGEQDVSIETKDVSIEKEVDAVYGEVLGVQSTVSGSWNDVMQYINLVENLPYNIWISSVNVSLEGDDQVESEVPVYVWEVDLALKVLKHPAS